MATSWRAESGVSNMVEPIAFPVDDFFKLTDEFFVHRIVAAELLGGDFKNIVHVIAGQQPTGVRIAFCRYLAMSHPGGCP